MKEATGEGSMTIVTIVIIVALAAAAAIIVGVMMSKANTAANTADDDVDKKYLNESHPYSLITSIGSTPLPSDLDIFLPSLSRISP